MDIGSKLLPAITCDADGLSTSEVACCAGLKMHRLTYWDEAGILKPSLSSASGRGSERRYSFGDLVLALMIAELCQRKWKMKAVRVAVKAVQDIVNMPAQMDCEPPRLVYQGTSLLILSRSQEGVPILVDAMQKGQLVLSMSLDTWQEEASRRLKLTVGLK